MKNAITLESLYRDYKSGRIGQKVFEAKLMFEIADRAPSMIRHGRKKDLSDFITWLYSRIVNAINNYRDNGSSFDAYIASSVHSAYKEYQSAMCIHGRTEKTVWSAKEYERREEDDALYLAENDDEELPPFIHMQNPRQILILLLKSYYFLSEDFINRIAPALGMDKENINMLILELRELRAAREQEIHDLRERVYAQFYRCLSFQKNASCAPPNSALENRYNNYLERGIRRLNSMRETLRTLHVDASNKEIAKVLGVSKGTVDASLYNVRKCYPGALPEEGGSDSPEQNYPGTPPDEDD
ncbi:MAG: LuxR family transcriptional regulator [Spirochaetaceae bacterium]|nr:LuxR family transcriptional regulator [Spirochaetaceae bacterium]